MKRNYVKALFAGLVLFGSNLSFGQAIDESFNDITTLAGSGWFLLNNSSPTGSTSWFQGSNVAAGGPFDAFSGSANAYIGANFNNTTGGSGIISTWLATPNRTFKNGDVITFYTRKPTILGGQTDYPDRLEVRLSTNGTSTNVGSPGNNVGDFTTLLMSVNPTLIPNVYPQSWTQYTITISGLPAPTSGRVAFRYFVTSAGPTGANSDYIGIDNFVYTPYVCPAFTMTAGGALTSGTAGSAYSTTLTQTGALGAPNFAVTAGALPPGLTLATNGTISGTPTATGTFNFTSTVSDASGCSGSQSYSITVVCPANPTTLNGLPALCSNDGAYTLTQGSPAGGTYSGTGVSTGQFDPAAGSQTITYDYTDPYGCAHATNAMITVNNAPSVSMSALADACENDADITLSGGMPAGGVYSGTGVSAGMFDPSSGTQTITYTYTDGNGCTDMASEMITVNVNPVVTLSAFDAVCESGGLQVLNQGMPAGGSYSGTGVSGNNFDPSAGTQMITYTYVDGNGCSEMAQETLTVNASPSVTFTSSITEVCQENAAFAISGGMPTGGTYSGSGVTGGSFDPGTAGLGSQDVTYTFVDGNGCEGEAIDAINVVSCLSIDGASTSDFVVYPNPSKSIATIQFNSDILNHDVKVVDLTGKKVNTSISVVGNSMNFDVQSLTSGSYFIVGSINDIRVNVKFEKID